MSDDSGSTSGSDSGNVFLELGGDPSIKHFELDDELSTPLRRVFKFVNFEGTHETLGLSDIMTMVRGPPENFLKINCVVLGVYEASTKMIGAIGKSESKSRDPRVMGISEWTTKIPLPLGGSLYPLLRIVYHLHSELSDELFKLCADVVPTPRQFIEGNEGQRPKMKRFLSWGHANPSTLRLHGGTVLALENPKNALDCTLADIPGTLTIVVNEAKPQEVIFQEPKYTWSEVVKKFL
jgi:hypothetical protein